MLPLFVGALAFTEAKAEHRQALEMQTPHKDGVIKGRVLDNNGEPLPGVGITMKDFKGGYISDMNGNFRIVTKRQKEVITFSFMGFKKKTVTAKPGQTLTIRLFEDREQLDEVVVTGFAPKSKLSYTGSQTTIKKDQLLSAGTKNLFESLETVVPGMMVEENAAAGSDPNKTPEISIRGRSSFEGKANMPVFIVDGSEVTPEYIYDMDMNDIETVTILKDASASALYGAKASAGVIVITTKALEGGKLKLNYSGTMRLSAPDLSDYDLLNAKQKLEYERLAGLYSSTNPTRQYELDQKYADIYNIVQRGMDIDWMAQPLRTGISQSHSLSIDGGDKRAKYNVGLRYANDQGVMKGSKRDRLSSFFKLSYNIPGKFYVMNSSTVSLVASAQSPYGDFGDYVKQNPYESPYDETGSLRKVLGNNVTNPLYEASLGSFNKTESLDFLNNTNLKVWFSQDFRFSADFSFQKLKSERNNFRSPLSQSLEMQRIKDPSLRGSLIDSYEKSLNYQGKMILSYNKNFGKLFLSTMAGATIESYDFNSASYKSVGFYTDKLAHPAFSTHYATGKPGGSDGRNTGVGFFANINAMYNNKYFLDVIYRYEGSSKFGRDQRFAPFWSVGGGWNLHNEKFFKKLGFSLLKLRASMGYLGNISFDPYQAMTTYTYTNGFNYVKGMGSVPITIGNPNLKWQRTLNSNIGLDINVIKGRLDFSADYYVKSTDDLLLNVTKAPSVGIKSAKENLGSIENKGFDLRLSATPIRTKDWQWVVVLNYSHNENKIKRISNALKSQNEKSLKSGGLAPLPIYEEGQSLTALKVVPSAGIDPATGREVFIKRDGSYTFDYDAHDKVVFGDTSPYAFGSISSYLTWKGLSLNASFGYSLGGLIYNTTLASRVEGSNPRFNADQRVFDDRWKEVGDNAKYKNIADSSIPLQTSRFVQTNNYLTLRNLTLAYDLPTSVLKSIHVRRLRLQLMSRNLFYLSSVKQERGLAYPFERSVELGLRFSL